MKGKFEILKQVRLGINLIVSYNIQTPLTVCQLDFKELIKHKRKDWNSNDTSTEALCKWLLIIPVIHTVISIMKTRRKICTEII